jgi:hypothetical protein
MAGERKGTPEDAMKPQRPVDKPIIYPCFLCNEPFQFGPHVYDGKHIRQWDITVCHRCYGNRDGIVPEQNSRLVDHLNAKGIRVQLNDKGYIDWPPL